MYVDRGFPPDHASAYQYGPCHLAQEIFPHQIHLSW